MWHPDSERDDIDYQGSILKKFADERGYEVVKEYCERMEEVANLNKSALDRLKEEAAENTWRIVLVSEQSKLSKSPIVYSAVIQELSEKGVEVEVMNLIKERIYLDWLERCAVGNATGKFFTKMRTDIAQRRAQIAAGNYE
jgi:DNA invertase Pin-like site-specific DNA recombinase